MAESEIYRRSLLALQRFRCRGYAVSFSTPSQFDALDALYDVDPIFLDRSLINDVGLSEFAKQAWSIVEPGQDMLWNWHLDLICKYLEKVSRKEILRLVINIPPGCMKSLLVSVFWPLWEWTQRRSTAFMFASFDPTLTLKQAGQVRKIIESEWFQERWGAQAEISEEEYEAYGELQRVVYDDTLRSAAGEFSIEGGGYRFSTSVAGKGTGRHVDIQVVDDPIKPKDAQNGKDLSAKLKETNAWWGGTMSSRHKDPLTFRRVVIMQRLHEADLAGMCINTGKYVHLCLPMEYEPDHPYVHPEDPRTEPGELLWPDRFNHEWCEEQKSSAGMGLTVYAAQCQQRPAPKGGSVFKLQYKQHWKPGQLPTKWMDLVQSWDCSFKKLDTSDFVAGGIWGFDGTDFYLLDAICARMSLTETALAIIAMRKKWPQARKILIEDKANGPGVADVLRKRVNGIELVDPRGGKESRANACEPYWTGRNIWLPPVTKDNEIWMAQICHQLEFFPFSAFDDLIDMMTQAILYMDSEDLSDYMEGIKAMKREMKFI